MFVFEGNRCENLEGRKDRETSQLLVTDGVSSDKWKYERAIDFYARFSYFCLLFVDRVIRYAAHGRNSFKRKHGADSRSLQ